MNAMLPAHLTETLNNLGDLAKALTEEVRADCQQREAAALEAARTARNNNRRVTTLLIVVALLVAGLGILGVSNRKLNKQNARIVERIESCTTVGRPCYEQQTQRTGEAVSSITRMVIYIHLCLRELPVGASDAEVESCALQRAQRAASEHGQPGLSGRVVDPKPAPSPTG